ncbi:hypothetical protein CW745_06000 [Psychromonas sp. psych-6C06]|nr:hypothetical protein CW745_06000 [Psychromonas sp. psych-6C06]
MLIIDATGPFNEELILHCQHSLMACIKVLEVKPWKQVVILHKMSLFTPEAELALTRKFN